VGHQIAYTRTKTGLVFLRARWLDPATGVFTSPDPAGHLTLDSYGYGGGDPLTTTDPLGLWPWDSWDVDWSEVGKTASNFG
jgi:RHS repeat-associated protein